MKKYIVLALLLIQGISYSQTVDIETAKTVSKNFFKYSFEDGIFVKDKYVFIETENLQIKNSYLKEYKGHPSMYITNFESGGWVITSSNKSVGPILAYSEQGSIDDYSLMPAVFTDWMLQYEQVIDSAYITKKNVEVKHDKWDNYENNVFEETVLKENNFNDTSKSTLKRWDDPNGSGFYLLDSEWGQDSPNIGLSTTPAYNILMNGDCSSGTGKYLAGCTAVAIGQIMKYWEFSTGSYADFNWWNMPDILSNYQNPNFNAECNDISYLLKRIGDRVDMDYGCSASSASTQDKGIYAFSEFGYKENNMNYRSKRFYSYNDWVDILKNDLDNDKPIIYTYTGISEGHAFVCDGYKYNSHEFHFNMGWNGGEYLIWSDFEDLKDTWYDFTNTIYHHCITGIEPNWIIEQNLQNISIITNENDSWINKQTYQAKKINCAGNNTTFEVGNQSNCRILAYESITLLPGYWSKPGSTALLKIFANSEGTLKSENLNYSNIYINSSYNNKGSNAFEIYPNPSNNGIFFFKTSYLQNEIIKFEICDINGKIINSFYPKTNRIDLSNYLNGLYLLNIYTTNTIISKKLIIQ